MHNMRCMIRFLALAALVALSAAPLTASATTQDDVLSARLLPGWKTSQGTYMTALHLALAPDWKTYWRSPGDAGIPPQFNWSGSQNLAAVAFHWPRPHVFLLNGLQSIGYKHELVLPIELTPKDPSQPILLRATVDLGICRDICLPAALSFTAEIGGAGAADPVIRAALADRPATAAEGGLGTIGCSVEPIADGLRVTARIALPATGGPETVVFEPGPAPIWVSQAVVSRSGGTLTATADLVSNSGTPVVFDRHAMTVTVLGQDRAVEISGCPAP
jgi:DsbC/DsbD-like thiol-disulfide interchange protein